MIYRLKRLLKLGRVTAPLRHELEDASSVTYIAEGVPMGITLRNFRAPGIVCGVRTMRLYGYVVITEHRLVIRAHGCQQIDMDLPANGPSIRQISVSREPGRIVLRYDASLLGERCSGDVTIRLHVTDGDSLHSALVAAGMQ